ncbi:MAG: Gfo/Idh/MocA family oxidoreductase [Actinomycetota bacterium]|jgi:predicted dehydrogenase|nr:Gfo/Idh/MocA family oxidoreductase [Actinomycetota bacterium]
MSSPTGVIRYGIIGTGMMGLEHFRNLGAVDGVEVTAMADPDEGSRQSARSTAEMAGRPVPEMFSDHRELLASGLCDAVVVASPNMTHAAVLLDVLAAGIHVLVEKPLCTTVADCEKVVAAAEDFGGVAWVGLEYRYIPPVAALIDRVRDGVVGDLRMMAIREHRYPFLPKVGNWNRFNRNTGGTLVEKCCHFFDLMNLVIGRDPVRVMASGAQDVNHLDERYTGEMPDIIDNAMVIVEYEGSARASLDLCMFAEASRNQEELSVVGDLGKVEAFVPSGIVRTGQRARGPWGVTEEVPTDDRIQHEGFHHGSSYLEHLDFLSAIRSGTPAQVSLADGLLSVAVGAAAQQSIAEHRAVEMSEVLAG